MRDLPAWKVEMYLAGLHAESVTAEQDTDHAPALPDDPADDDPGAAFTELPPYLRT